MLLHLQGHDLLLLSVGQVVGGAPLRAAAPVDVMPALVLLVVKSGEGQDVEEEKGGSHGDGHRQLSGVVALVHQVWLVVAVLGLSGEGSWVGALGHQNLGLWGAVGSLWRRNLKNRKDNNKFKDMAPKNTLFSLRCLNLKFSFHFFPRLAVSSMTEYGTFLPKRSMSCLLNLDT